MTYYPEEDTDAGTSSAVWCVMVYDGTDTDGTIWNRCTVHNRLASEGAYVCEGYEPPPYVERQTGRRIVKLSDYGVRGPWAMADCDGCGEHRSCLISEITVGGEHEDTFAFCVPCIVKDIRAMERAQAEGGEA